MKDKIKHFAESFIHQYKMKYKVVDKPKSMSKTLADSQTNQADSPLAQQEIADRQNKIILDANRPWLEQIVEMAEAGDPKAKSLLENLEKDPKLMNFLMTGG